MLLRSAFLRHLPRFRYFSGGRRVSRAVWRMIRAGNEAREQQNWGAASAAYQNALGKAPWLGHIWIQYGHALKEAGQLASARDAYVTAAGLNPDDAEPLIQTGHVLKKQQEYRGAASAYLKAAQLSPERIESLFEYARSTPEISTLEISMLRDVMRSFVDEQTLDRIFIQPVQSILLTKKKEIAYDITDLIAFFGRSRLPTGIQRVQIEILSAILASEQGEQTRLLCFVPGRRGWVTIPSHIFRHIITVCRLGANIDQEWHAALSQCYCIIAISQICDFSTHKIQCLVNIGTSWSETGYFDSLEYVKNTSCTRFLAFVYDLIPVLFPHLFVGTLATEFDTWLSRLLQLTDQYIAISTATAQDLMAVAADRGFPVSRSDITILPLNADFRSGKSGLLKDIVQRELGLGNHPYVLMVSTLEPRKNHLGAFAAWQILAHNIDAHELPTLVCVGGAGWLNAEIHVSLSRDSRLRSNVRLFSGITDQQLASLYENCLFTLYPSYYEGWGLPVTESLCYGKIPAISKTSSLPEAGGHWAIYFDPEKPASIASAIQPFILDAKIRSERENLIKNTFHPQLWSEIANTVQTASRAVK